jgi:hypothetical protein
VEFSATRPTGFLDGGRDSIVGVDSGEHDRDDEVDVALASASLDVYFFPGAASHSSHNNPPCPHGVGRARILPSLAPDADRKQRCPTWAVSHAGPVRAGTASTPSSTRSVALEARIGRPIWERGSFATRSVPLL